MAFVMISGYLSGSLRSLNATLAVPIVLRASGTCCAASRAAPRNLHAVHGSGMSRSLRNGVHTIGLGLKKPGVKTAGMDNGLLLPSGIRMWRGKSKKFNYLLCWVRKLLQRN